MAFFTMMAVLTIMYMAANFGKKEIGLKDEVLIPTILIIQLVGVAGSIHRSIIASLWEYGSYDAFGHYLDRNLRGSILC